MTYELFKDKDKLETYLKTLYRAVNTFHFGCKNESIDHACRNKDALFWEQNKTR
jgi:hypothetical protein